MQNSENLNFFGFTFVFEVVGDVLEEIDIRTAGLVSLVLVDFGGDFISFSVREHNDPF